MTEISDKTTAPPAGERLRVLRVPASCDGAAARRCGERLRREPLLRLVAANVPDTEAGPEADTCYRDLLGAAAWRRLPREVRLRFSKRIDRSAVAVYRGEVVVLELSAAGWLLAQATRALGGMLPNVPSATGLTIVTVTASDVPAGQLWTRSYPRPGRLPQVIQSVKHFGGPTGLEEHLGAGLVMRLTLHAEGQTLVFRSAGYAVTILGRTLTLPRWLSPGRCEVRHRAETDRRFSFTLTLDHPLLGRLLRQVAFYEEA